MKTRYIIIIIISIVCGGISLTSLIIDFNILSLYSKIGLLLMLFVCIIGLYLACYHIYLDRKDKSLKSKNKHLYEQPGVALQARAEDWWQSLYPNTRIAIKNKYLPSSTMLELSDDDITMMYKQEHFVKTF